MNFEVTWPYCALETSYSCMSLGEICPQLINYQNDMPLMNHFLKLFLLTKPCSGLLQID